MAAVQPMAPKNGAYTGHSAVSILSEKRAIVVSGVSCWAASIFQRCGTSWARRGAGRPSAQPAAHPAHGVQLGDRSGGAGIRTFVLVVGRHWWMDGGWSVELWRVEARVVTVTT
jgi:hypothetical protein